MYTKYWSLTKKPFENTADPHFLYFSSRHEEALSRLAYAIREKKGAALLTGVFGCGKTLLVQALLNELSPEKYKLAIINNPQMEYVELLSAIVGSLKAVELPMKKSDLSVNFLLKMLEQILQNNLREGKETVIIIDEAHVIQDERVFEGLRMLLNFQLQESFLLTLVLLGQPELKQKVEDNQQLEQRIAIKYHLYPLVLEETMDYISYRIKIAGREEPIFTREAMECVYEHTGGIPRRINRLCDICLVSGFSRQLKRIDKDIVLEEIEGLEEKG